MKKKVKPRIKYELIDKLRDILLEAEESSDSNHRMNARIDKAWGVIMDMRNYMDYLNEKIIKLKK